MKRTITTFIVLATLSASAYACRTWTTTTTYGGRVVTCYCMDCGIGPQCNCN